MLSSSSAYSSPVLDIGVPHCAPYRTVVRSSHPFAAMQSKKNIKYLHEYTKLQLCGK